LHLLDAADQHARIDAERPADQGQHDDAADAEAPRPAGDAHATAAAILDVGGGPEIFPAHLVFLRRPDEARSRRQVKRDDPAEFREG
jgi:hypothetical protein